MPVETANDRLAREGGPFVVVPAWVLSTDLSDGALRTYCVLAGFADHEGASWPSRRTLAERMHCSIDTVDRRVMELKEAGLLRAQGRASAEGRQTSNLWILVSRHPQAAILQGGGRVDAAPGGRVDAAPGTRSNRNQLQSTANLRDGGAARSPADSGERPQGTANPLRTAREIQAELDAVERSDPDTATSALETMRATLRSKPRPVSQLFADPDPDGEVDGSKARHSSNRAADWPATRRDLE
jgi:Helix-turn-helix domain